MYICIIYINNQLIREEHIQILYLVFGISVLVYFSAGKNIYIP